MITLAAERGRRSAAVWVQEAWVDRLRGVRARGRHIAIDLRWGDAVLTVVSVHMPHRGLDQDAFDNSL